MLAEDIGRVGQLGGIFKPGAAASSFTFEFRVSPTPPTLPIVRSLGETPQQPTLTLPVTAMAGGYSVVLTGSPPEGRLLIEISYPGMGAPEFHDADFALREHVSDSPASRPSRSGRFQVFTRPQGVSSALQLLIGSTELPIDDLPPGVTRTSVVGVYSVDFLNESTPVTGWKLTLAGSGVTPVLFFLPTGSTVWQSLSVAAIDGQPLLGADFAGAGTYLLGGN